MIKAVEDAYASIHSQLPGRFIFQRVDDPKQADFSFGAVPQMHDYIKRDKTLELGASGVTEIGTGAILFSAAAFSGSYNADMLQTAMHEIEHGFGADHPQGTPGENLKSKAPLTKKASFLSTTMTYPENNSNSARPLEYVYGDPISMMPSDLQMMIKHYPIAADRTGAGPMIGSPPGLRSDPLVTVTLQHDNGTKDEIHFPSQEGTAFQPMIGAPLDLLKVQGLPGGHVFLDVQKTGLFAHPDNSGSTITPIYPLKIQMSPDVNEELQTYGNTIIDNSVPSKLSGGDDIINFRGTKNELTMNATDFAKGKISINCATTSEVRIELKGSDALATAPIDIRNIFTYEGEIDGKKIPTTDLATRWHRMGNEYRFRTGSKNGLMDETTVYVHLDTKNPKAHAAFQSAIVLKLGAEYMLEADDPKEATMDDVDASLPNGQPIDPNANKHVGKPKSKFPSSASKSAPNH